MKKPDKYHWHEALDRVHVASCNWDEHISTHTAIKSKLEIKQLADQIGDLMGDLYQKIGQIHAMDIMRKNKR